MVNQLKDFMYKLLTLFFPNGISRIINGESVRLPVRVSRYYQSDYETATQDFLTTHAGGCSIDVGAHIGLYTVMLSRNSEQVIAFEPSTDTYSVLLESLRINSCENVLPINAAASSSTSIGLFYTTDNAFSSANSLSPLGNPNQKLCLEIDCLNKDLDLLKVDAEGAELLVLQGAKSTLFRTKFLHLAIHTEQSQLLGFTISDILRFLKTYRPTYRIKGTRIEENQISTMRGLFDLEIAINGFGFKTR